MMDRRSFLKGVLWVAAAPIIVKASSLMHLSARPKILPEARGFYIRGWDQYGNEIEEFVRLPMLQPTGQLFGHVRSIEEAKWNLKAGVIAPPSGSPILLNKARKITHKWDKFIT